jgi:hypothetical protein
MKHQVELRPGSEPDLGGRSPILPLMFRQPASLLSVAAHNRNHPLARLNSTPRKVLSYQTPLEVFTAHIMKSVRIELEFRRRCVSKTSQTVWKRSGEWHLTVSDPGKRSPFPGARMTDRQLHEGARCILWGAKVTGGKPASLLHTALRRVATPTMFTMRMKL